MASHRILFVDDEDGIAFAIASYFAFSGYRVDRAEGSATARRLLRKTRYSLLIADLDLGEETAAGLKVIDEARSLYPGMPAILLTAYRTPKVDAQARRRKVSAILNKPIPLAELQQIVGQLLTPPAARKHHVKGAGR